MRNPFAEFLARKFGKTAPAADTDAETTEVVEEEAEEEPQEPEGDEHGETAETDGDEGEAVPADDLDQADEDGQAPEPEAVSGAPAAEVTAEAPAAIAAAPERGSRELFQVLSARFGATFADRAIDAGWTYAEALEQRVIELETERANQAALIDKSGVLGEAATSSHAEEDPKAEARKIKAAELERKGLTRGQAAFAATLRFAPEVEQN